MGRKRTGSVRQVGPEAFEVRIAGKQIGTYPTEDKANAVCDAHLDLGSASGGNTFVAHAADWMVRREVEFRQIGRARSFERELSRWRTHVVNAPFWDLPWKRQSTPIFQAWIDKLSTTKAVQTITFGRDKTKRTERRKTDRYLSRKTISEVLNLVQLCVDDAIRRGKLPGLVVDGKIVAGNPARMVLLPRAAQIVDDDDTELIVHLAADEIRALFALDLPPFQRAVFAVAIYAGLRRGELWGLRWQDVVFDGPYPVLRVRRSYDGALKTKYSRRDVPMLPPVVDALKAWRATERARIGAALVFPNEDSKCFSDSYDAGWRDHPQQRGGKLRVTPGWRALAEIRDEVTFHALRHTCGCHLAQGTWLGERFDLHQIKTWLGHSSIAVTERHYAAHTAQSISAAVAAAGFVGYKRRINGE